ncbi:MAG: Stp1/IreP family PP2C-type Ser/Thr phosphatase [Myxococcales bacterium]|nr:Stp1/IreP family PP2C-type Ser/Thr phosphatase [Myxococcales bacterium]
MKASDKNRPLVGRCTDVGKIRSANEDNMGDLPIDQGHVLIVADGMGGYRGGALASHLVVEAIEEYFRDARVETPPKAMRQAICLANERIYLRGQQEEELSRMGSTCVLAMVREGLTYLAHVGDSRIYLLRKGGKLQQLTRDHTVVQHFVDVGLLSPEEADGHPDSHILSRALGPRAHVEPELSEFALRLRPGDRILLCSDGLTKMIRDPDIEKILQKGETPQDAAEDMVQTANDNGGEDNVTVLIYEYHPTTQEEWDALEKEETQEVPVKKPASEPASEPHELEEDFASASTNALPHEEPAGEQHDLDPLPKKKEAPAAPAKEAAPKQESAEKEASTEAKAEESSAKDDAASAPKEDKKEESSEKKAEKTEEPAPSKEDTEK